MVRTPTSFQAEDRGMHGRQTIPLHSADIENDFTRRLLLDRIGLPRRLADTAGTGFTIAATNSAPSAVQCIKGQIRANTIAPRSTARTRFVTGNAHSIAAIGRGTAADMAAGTTVVGVGIQEGACPIAIVGSFDAGIFASAVNTGTVFVGTRLVTLIAAGSAVVAVVIKVGAGIVSTESTETARVTVARPTGRKTGILILLAGTSAEGFAGIVLGGRLGGSETQRA